MDLTHNRREVDVTQHVVVGIDGSRASRRAIRWVIEQAGASGTTVEVVHVWTSPDMGTDPLAHALGEPRKLEEQARCELQLVVDEADEPGMVVRSYA